MAFTKGKKALQLFLSPRPFSANDISKREHVPWLSQVDHVYWSLNYNVTLLGLKKCSKIFLTIL